MKRKQTKKHLIEERKRKEKKEEKQKGKRQNMINQLGGSGPHI